MRKGIIVAASALVLAGCCTTRQNHVIRWEYKVEPTAEFLNAQPGGNTNEKATFEEKQKIWFQQTQSQLDELGRDGWVLVCIDGGVVYLKRPMLWIR